MVKGSYMITIEGFLLGSFVVTCIYHFFLFVFYKKNYAALYFSLITFSASFLTVIKQTQWIYKEKAIMIIFILVPLMYIEFTRHMYKDEFSCRFCKLIDNMIYVYTSLYTFFILALSNDYFLKIIDNLGKITIVVDTLLIIYMISQLIKASIRKKSDSRLMLMGFLILFISALIIYMIPSNMFIKNNAIGALGILMIYSLTLARRYSNAYNSCEELVLERTEELWEKNDRLLYLLNHDTLTGVFSRKFILDNLEKYFLGQSPFSIIMYDMDKFKDINDNYGHNIGDEVLVRSSEKTMKILGNRGSLGRLGGEEFLIIFPGINFDEAFAIGEEVRRAINSLYFEGKSKKFRVSCSMGLVEFDKKFNNYDDMLIRADKALYRAKETGRDKLCY